MPEPAQKPHRSKQDYQTPPEFIAAVVARFGPIAWDLAADEHNALSENYFDVARDSLSWPWHKLTGNLWLNPPFGEIPRWAAKCLASRGPGRRIIMLSPASAGTNWFSKYVHGKALVLGLNPRLTFVGTGAPYPKDLMLTVWADTSWNKFDVWRWDSAPTPAQLVLDGEGRVLGMVSL
jgi:phage N-6-adenine-methyltransferase